MTRRIAIYGGTFDPIHNGHLGSIDELRNTLKIDLVHLVPSYIPPHRGEPGASAQQRLEMLELAAGQAMGLVVDNREVERQGTSYSIDTLSGFRQEYGPDVELLFVMGDDAFALLHTWHRWREITDFAHIIVMARPNMIAEQPDSMVLEWCSQRRIESSAELEGASGRLLELSLEPRDVSATEIRQRVKDQLSIEELVPKVVANYITGHKLYL